jgi:GAF domain-containing protein
MKDNSYQAEDESIHARRTPAPSQTVAGIEGLLLEIANLLATKLNPESLFETIAEVLARLLKIDRATLAIYDPKRDQFEIVALALQQGSHIGKGWFIPHRGSRVGLVSIPVRQVARSWSLRAPGSRASRWLRKGCI